MYAVHGIAAFPLEVERFAQASDWVGCYMPCELRNSVKESLR
jgi:hypothetical protein